MHDDASSENTSSSASDRFEIPCRIEDADLYIFIANECNYSTKILFNVNTTLSASRSNYGIASNTTETTNVQKTIF